MDEWNEAMFEEGFEEEEEFEPSKEQLFFLIDASAPMLEPCEAGDVDDEGDQDFKGLTWLEAGVKVAVRIMRQKIICGARDEAAVMLYNAATTSSTKELGEFIGCYLLQGLGAPDAEAVQRLEAFSVEAFNRKIRSGDDPGPSLIGAFWMAKSMITREKHAKATRRILVFTRSQEPFPRFDKGHDPSRSWRTLQAHLRDLQERGAGVELYPMVAPGHTFDLEPFWRGVLRYLRVGAGEEGEEEEAQQVFRLRDLFTVVRSKAHRKRSVGSLRWSLGVGLDLAVKLYQLVQPQKPPGLLHISARDGHEVKANTGQVDFLTGLVLSPAEIRHYFFKKAERYPRVYMSREEIAAIKGQGQAGMTLLGFKPASCLEEHHNIRNSTFVYPDDKAQPGSATCFIALWSAMQQSGMMAVCALAATRARSPALVALLPQEEVLYDDGSGAQAVPPGLQLVYLPFHDDIRAPEAHPDFVGPLRHAPSEAQVAAAEVLLAELQLTEFDCRSVVNPALQRHYEVLEALALNEPPPLLEDSAVGDPTLPAWEEQAVEGMEEEEAEAAAARLAAILGFKDAVGLGEEEARKGAAKKRPPPGALGGDELAALGVEAKAAAGTLKSLTVDQLKAWLRAHGCAVGGKKDELIARVHNKLGL